MSCQLRLATPTASDEDQLGRRGRARDRRQPGDQRHEVDDGGRVDRREGEEAPVQVRGGRDRRPRARWSGGAAARRLTPRPPRARRRRSASCACSCGSSRLAAAVPAPRRHRGVQQVGGRHRRRGGLARRKPRAHAEVDEQDADGAERDRDAPAGDETGDESRRTCPLLAARPRFSKYEPADDCDTRGMDATRPRDPRRARARCAALLPRPRRARRAERQRRGRPRAATPPRRRDHRLHRHRRPGRGRPPAARADRRATWPPSTPTTRSRRRSRSSRR